MQFLRYLATLTAVIFVGILALTGCSSTATPTDKDTGIADGGADVKSDTGFVRKIKPILTPETDPNKGSGESYKGVVGEIRIPERTVMNGRSYVEGFDMDEAASDGRDGTGCGRQDWYDYESDIQNVDNALEQIARIAKSMFDMNESIVEALQAGELLLLTDLSAVNDLKNDEFVQLTLQLAEKPDTKPMLSEGWLAPGQAFVPDAESPPITINGYIDDGFFYAASSETIQLFFNANNVPVSLPLANARIKAFSVVDGLLGGGVLGGTISIVELKALVAAVDENYVDAVEGFANGLLDVDSDDGTCAALSTGLIIRTVTATHLTEKSGQ